jgi:hypothetical protein
MIQATRCSRRSRHGYRPRLELLEQRLTLSTYTKKTFAKGAQGTVVATPPGGVTSASGALLEASDTDFTIQPKATRIVPG